MAEAVKPLSAEAIALIDKKMSMTLDDLIAASKTKTSTKPIVKNSRRLHMARKSSFATDSHAKPATVQRFMESRSGLRRETLAQRRSTFHENQFFATTQITPRKSVFHHSRLIMAEKVISKSRRSVKWNRGVGFVTPSYSKKQQALKQHDPIMSKQSSNNKAGPEMAVWRQSGGTSFGKFTK